MAERPLLLFPSRSKISFEKKQGGSGIDFKTPTKLKQSARINSMFKRLNSAFETQNVIVNTSADGLVPEMVLVFETRGRVDEFFKAVARIPELKWLGEYADDFPPTDDFKYENSDKLISGKLFFLLADNSAIKELKSLWGVWKSKKQNFKLRETKWKQLFNLLVDIRPWGVKDRMEETGILLDLKHRIEENKDVIPFEIEMWYRKSKRQRKINSERIRSLILNNDGRIIGESDIDEISYHGILAEAPINIFNELSEEKAVNIFRSSDIMYIRPVGQSILKVDQHFVSEPSIELLPESKDLLPPVIALLDGMPVQNHLYLKNRIEVYDSDGFEANYPVDKRIHCTGMASLIIHGDLGENNIPLRSKLLVRPVMHFHPINATEAIECMPENVLLIDLIHKAVNEIVKGSSSIQPIATSVKIINLSLGDNYRVFDGTMSPWARLIDWLSEKYNLLFIISSGNVYDEIEINPGGQNFNDFFADIEKVEHGALKFMYNKNRFRRLIAPAESMNALTIGASHDDASSNYNLNNNIDLFHHPELFSPISRTGLGYRRSIKPDLLAKGGKILFRNVGNGILKYSKVDIRPPGIKVAAPGEGGNRIIYSKGTSNAAAIVSNTAGKIFESFLDDELLKSTLTDDYFAVTAKALLVHSTSWNPEVMNAIINANPNVANKKDLIARLIGYGNLQPERILECTSKRVTLIGCENITPENAYVYELPLPNILSGTTKWRKLSVTLAWLTPINTNNQLYRTHKLWFEFPNKDYDAKLKAKRVHYDADTVRRGTLQHEVFFSESAQAFSDNSVLKIKVNCKTDAAKYDSISFSKNKDRKSIRYALIVTLEVDPEIGLDIDIYTEVNTRIKIPIRESGIDVKINS